MSDFPARSVLLPAVQTVLETYHGIAITVRQCYYRLVAAAIISNSIRSYKNLVVALTKWRWDGTLPIEAFEDRTRAMLLHDTGWRQDDPLAWARAWLQEGLKNARDYRLARWFGQKERVVVAVEKQALQGPFEEVCTERGVDLAVCRGYPSVSFLAEAAQRMLDEESGDGRSLWILYFGDHDPSGQDIPRAVRERLEGFFNVQFEYHRVALNPDQVDAMNLIPAPVKMTDARASGFVAEHGENVYELDAIEPDVLQSIVRKAIDKHFSPSAFKKRNTTVDDGRALIEQKLQEGGVDDLLQAFNEGEG
jgi:hypothetical protein